MTAEQLFNEIHELIHGHISGLAEKQKQKQKQMIIDTLDDSQFVFDIPNEMGTHND